MKILIKMPNWVGDCLIASPSIRYLRKHNPEAEIHLLVRKPLVPLFEYNPHVNQVTGYSFRKGLKGFFDLYAFAKRLQKEQFQKAYIYPRSWKSALLIFLALIPERIGYANQSRGLLLTRQIPRSSKILKHHQADYYLNLVSGEQFVPSGPRKADLVLDPYMEQWAQEWMRKNFGGKKVVGIAPGATFGSAKMWLPQRFEETARRLNEDPDTAVLFLGGPKEAPWINSIAEKIPGVVSMAGRTRLAELAALMKACSAVLSNDSGPMHVAAAVGAPLVVLFGPTSYENTAPMGPHTLIHKRVVCSPCLLRHCPIDHKCMKQISVGEVVAAVEKKLKETPAEPVQQI